MSLSKRLMDLMRSNINAFGERATSWSRSWTPSIEEYSDEELETELRRRHARREAEAARAETDSSSERYRTTSQQRSSRRGHSSHERGYRRPGASHSAGGSARLAVLYAQLECPNGADMTTVRRHYRRLMRKYHPDMHAGWPDKQRIATELSQRLTAAYNELRKSLSAGR